jgi:hypothetical protein
VKLDCQHSGCIARPFPKVAELAPRRSSLPIATISFRISKAIPPPRRCVRSRGLRSSEMREYLLGTSSSPRSMSVSAKNIMSHGLRREWNSALVSLRVKSWYIFQYIIFTSAPAACPICSRCEGGRQSAFRSGKCCVPKRKMY